MPLEVLLLGALALLASAAWLLQRWRLRRLIATVRAAAWSLLANQRSGLNAQLAQHIVKAVRALQAQAHSSDERLQEFLKALQHSPGGVVLLDNQGRIEWCNATAANHFGLDLLRDQQQHIGFLVRDPAFAGYLASWNFSREVTIDCAAPASTAHLRIAVQAHAYAGNRRLLLSRDVTQAEQLELMRRDFVANVSHELRTPLTVLSGFVESLQNLDLDTVERNRALALMAQQSQRMQALVDDLLALSQLEAAPAPGFDMRVELAALLQSCLADARALDQALTPASPRRISLSNPNILTETSIAVDSQELSRALGNLLANAIRHTPPGSAVEAGFLALADGSAEIFVQDHGPGIPAEHLARLGERFYRVDRSRSRDSGGTGLGLAIAKEIALRHGGQLKIESARGHGARFALVLPRQRVLQRQQTAEAIAQN